MEAIPEVTLSQFPGRNGYEHGNTGGATRTCYGCHRRGSPGTHQWRYYQQHLASMCGAYGSELREPPSNDLLYDIGTWIRVSPLPEVWGEFRHSRYRLDSDPVSDLCAIAYPGAGACHQVRSGGGPIEASRLLHSHDVHRSHESSRE